MSTPQISPDELYHRLGRLAAEPPIIRNNEKLDSTALQWLSRASVLIPAVLGSGEGTEFSRLVKRLAEVPFDRHKETELIHMMLHRALAVAEMDAPTASQGAFIPVGNAFDAVNEISKIFGTASRDVFLVDPYMDEKVLTSFAGLVPEGLSLRLLGDPARKKPALKPASQSWVVQYGASRPLDVRLSQSGALHDRLILIDSSNVWVVTQSFNAIATRSPASLLKVDSDMASLKASAYGALWNSAAPLL